MSLNIEKLLNLFRREAESATRRHGMGWRFGIVQQYDPAGPAVRVSFPDDLDETGQPSLSTWMPIILSAAGPNAGVCAAPTIGTQAIILHRGHGHERETFMLGVVRSSADPAPSDPTMPGQAPPQPGTPEGEWWLVHRSGTFLKFKDGHIESGGGTWKHTGDIQATGSVSAGGNTAASAGASGTFTDTTGKVITVRQGLVASIQ